MKVVIERATKREEGREGERDITGRWCVTIRYVGFHRKPKVERPIRALAMAHFITQLHSEVTLFDLGAI